MQRHRRTAALVVAIGITATAFALSTPASAEGNSEWTLLNDSPSYSFGAGNAPVRNAPLAVTSLHGTKSGSALEFDITKIVDFEPSGPVLSGRIGFYSAPKRRPMITGGVDFTFAAGDEAANGALVERESEGTATSAEVWRPADENFGTTKIEYKPQGVELTITPKGEYRRLLRDPLTSVGLDLWRGDAATNVQPSVRVSLGDLLGSKPGLLPLQGTGVGADGTPQPWITRAVASDFSKWRVRTTAEAKNPQLVNLDIGKYDMHALQLRLFVANQFSALPPGSAFPPYDLVLFAPDDMSTKARRGDAFSSSEVGAVTIEPGGKGAYTLKFTDQLHAGLAAVHVVVPGQTDGVLLATGFQYKF